MCPAHVQGKYPNEVCMFALENWPLFRVPPPFSFAPPQCWQFLFVSYAASVESSSLSRSFTTPVVCVIRAPEKTAAISADFFALSTVLSS